MSAACMENGTKWLPGAGVVPVIQSAKMRRVYPWVHKRMLSGQDAEAGKAAAMDLVLRFKLGRLAVESGGAERVEVWSEKAFLPLDDVLLLGDSAGAAHRWTLTRGMFAEDHPALAVWMEEPLEEAERLDLIGFLGHPGLFGKGVLPGGGRGVVVADLGRMARREELPWLDRVAKSCGAALLVGADLRDVRGEPVDATSYATIAMQTALERGIDLTWHVRTIAVVDEPTDGGSGWRGRILRAEGDEMRFAQGRVTSDK